MGYEVREGRIAATALSLALLFALTACGGGGDGVLTPAPAPAPTGPVAPPSTDPRTAILVTKDADDGSEGTLRSAILRSNGAPGTYRIVFVPPTSGTLTIKPTTQLPTIVGPARLEGPWAGIGTAAPTVAIDGSALLDLTQLNSAGNPTACPGEASGQFGANVRSLKNAGLQVVDSSNVEFTGFEVRKFCSGIMVLRSKNNLVSKMRLVGNLGAAGVLLSGDAGDTGGSATSGLNVNNIVEYSDFLNNSDSMDVARGSDNAIIRFNRFVMDSAGIVPSQGVEVLSSSTSTITDNTFSGFSEPLQVGGNGHQIARNTIVNSAVAMTLSGTGSNAHDNIIHGNRTGIATRGGNNTLSKNLIFDNGKDISLCNAGGICSTNVNWLNAKIGISLNGTAGTIANDLAASCGDGFADCDTRQNYPVMGASFWQPSGFTVAGTLATRPNQQFVIEIFASRSGDAQSRGQAEVYLGAVTATSDASGNLVFSYPTLTTNPLRDGTKAVYFSATATRVSTGQTSEISAAALTLAP